MDTTEENDIITISLSIFKIIGEGNRHNEDKFIYIFRLVNICMFIWNLIVVLGSAASAKGFVYIKVMESAIACTHGLLKYIYFIYYKSDIQILLDNLRYFWKTSKVKEVNRKANLGYKYLWIGQRVYVGIAVILMFIYYTKPLLREGGRFVFETWLISDSPIMESFILISQYYFFLVCVPIISSYDLFYFIYAFRVIMQLKLLKYTFEHVDRDDAVNELHKCIRQHQFLLRVFDRMRKVYFWIMLLHYAITLVTGCTHLYIVLVAEVEPSEMVASVIYLWAVFIEFGGYTIPVEEIVFQLKDLSRATYMSTWYDWSVTERQDLLIIMMKSQRQKYVSAAGLMDMNVDTFGSVIRKIFSFYVILRNLLNK